MAQAQPLFAPSSGVTKWLSGSPCRRSLLLVPTYMAHVLGFARGVIGIPSPTHLRHRFVGAQSCENTVTQCCFQTCKAQHTADIHLRRKPKRFARCLWKTLFLPSPLPIALTKPPGKNLLTHRHAAVFYWQWFSIGPHLTATWTLEICQCTEIHATSQIKIAYLLKISRRLQCTMLGRHLCSNSFRDHELEQKHTCLERFLIVRRPAHFITKCN